MKREFPPEDWLVDGLITTGLSVLTGASKIGKSWAALQLVTALDQGGCFLGTLKARRVDVVYCALEDTPKRIQGRLRKQDISVFNGSRLETKRRTPADLRAFLKENPQFRVVIIDTFQKMMGINDLNDYSQTVNGMSALKDIADSLNIAVIVIHHNRKGGDNDGDHMESALGSTGINATADTTLTMRRKRGTSEATLSVTGRDIEDTTYTLSWDKDICSWAVTNQAALKPTLSEAQQQIIDLLESEEREFSTQEVADTLKKDKGNISRYLKDMVSGGYIASISRGKWASLDVVKLYSIKGDTTLQQQESYVIPFPEANPIEATEGEPEIW
jgi:RecA-family ATPase